MRRALAHLAALASVSAVAALLGGSAPARADESASGQRLVRPEPRPPMVVVPRVEIIDDTMRAVPTFAQDGRRFVLGQTGERYRVHIVNPTASRFEAVVSVDGLDAIDGHTAGLGKRGYVIPAFGDVTIDGWRTSLEQVAAFRFSSVRASYAARTGSDRNVGVIGVAFFRERERPPIVWRRPLPPRPARAHAEFGAGGSASPAPAPPADVPNSAPAGTASAAADGRAPAKGAAAGPRPGLGTQFGEAHDSRVELTSFERADARPAALVELRYDDREGLLARGIRLPPRDGNERDAENMRRDAAQAFAGMGFAQPPR